MSFMEAVLLGVALSMDSFAVSVTNGMQLDKVTLPYTLAVSLMFDAFQALMPLIGFFCGSLFYAYIEAVDHWIVLALLCALGGKMIFEAVRKWHASYEFKKKAVYGRYLPLPLLFVQGMTTGIDALAVGIGLAVINADIKLSALTIGVTTALVCLLAMYIGKKTGDVFNEKARFAGGCMLVGIGIKICVQHVIARGDM